jgi:hypothetical protein
VGPPVAGVALAIVLVRVVRLEGVKVPTRVSRICPLNNFFPPCRCCNPSAAQRAMHAALFSPTIPSPGLFLRVPLSRPRPLDSTRWICCQSCKRVANLLSLRRSLLTSAAISGTGATRTLIIFSTLSLLQPGSAAQRAMHGALFSPTHPNVPCPERIVARPATQRLLPPPDSRAFYVSASET